MPTIAQTIISSLERRGWAIVPDASRRYTVLHKPDAGGAAWVWVGRNGAARFSSIKRVDTARPFSDRSRAILLAGRADNPTATAV